MFDLPPPDPSLEISIASRGYSKGLAQTDGGQLIVRGELGLGDFYVAAQAKNVDSNGARGEALAQIGARGDVAGFALNAAIAYKMLVGLDAPTDGNIFEFTASASRAFGPVTPRLAITFSFDDLGAVRESLYAEAGASVRIASGTSLVAAIGRRERSGGADYTAFNAGLSHAFGRHVTAELRYYDTAESARGDVYRGRAVAALRFRF
jgi:uncharacterized protein (TIGR02001 family)